MANKSNISEFMNNSDLDKNIAALATKVELKAEHNKIVKLQAYYSNFYFRGKSHFEDAGTQYY